MEYPEVAVGEAVEVPGQDQHPLGPQQHHLMTERIASRAPPWIRMPSGPFSWEGRYLPPEERPDVRPCPWAEPTWRRSFPSTSGRSQGSGT